MHVDDRERYGYRFARQQVVVRRSRLAAGDYAVLGEEGLLATVERKSLADLVASLTSGRLGFQLAELAAVPRAAVVVEDRYSAVFKLDRVRPALVADGLAECQVRWPSVPVIFAETRQLAEEWTYRFLAAPPSPAEVRVWAQREGHVVSDRGRVPGRLVEAFLRARSGDT
ncbi:ERCC4 domain-containing protein [Nocardioides lianchengensis]|uniref:ERCC4 domain-containing protein n=1 Tax=Nocardioides lianchengensis TaxID=1045774 RepID=UPI001FCDABA7|nr:ERCC4 domain-containing protein [Nocardioides lianchengensis]